MPNLNIPMTCYSSIRRGRLCTTSQVGIGHLGTLVYHSFRFRGIRLFNAMLKQIRDLSCSVSSFKYQLDKYLSTIPDTPCIANYDNSLENSSQTNPHRLIDVHPVGPDTLIKGQTTTSITSIKIYANSSVHTPPQYSVAKIKFVHDKLLFRKIKSRK